MAAGGYIYEKETATYDSSTFDTKLKWALHVFRKQIYAFLKASTRSASVNGDEASYWDLDESRASSGAYALDDDATTDGVAQIHTDAEWQSVSPYLNEETAAANSISPIFSYTNDTDRPALGCFFTGENGEHLFFCNCRGSKWGTVSAQLMPWYAAVNEGWNPCNSSVRRSTGSDYEVPVGFSVMFSPEDDFVGNDPSIAGFRPVSCLAPMAISHQSASSSQTYVDGSTNVIIGNTTAQTYKFGFVVKRDQLAYMIGRDNWGVNVYKYILFGNILDALVQSGDTHRQASISLRESNSETATGSVSTTSELAICYEDNTTQVAVEFANANGECAFRNSGVYSNSGTHIYGAKPASVPTASAGASVVPYAPLQVFCAPFKCLDGIARSLVKDGMGAKGIISTDLLRIVPAAKCVGGATFEGGKFMTPASYLKDTSTGASLSFAIGWDPSNEL